MTWIYRISLDVNDCRIQSRTVFFIRSAVGVKQVLKKVSE